jgi:hypothetical protein
MKQYIVAGAEGQILRSGTCQDEAVSGQAADGETAFVTTDTAGVEAYYVQDGVLHPKGTQPSDNHTFDYTTKTWVDPRTLADLKTAKWAEIKAARDSAEFGTFSWDGASFDSDAASQSRIQGAAQLATLATINSQPFSIDWTLADNAVRTLAAADMSAVGMAMGVHINTQHTLARLKRVAIEAAATPAEVDAVSW